MRYEKESKKNGNEIKLNLKKQIKSALQQEQKWILRYKNILFCYAF